jgi:hypothetical protein
MLDGLLAGGVDIHLEAAAPGWSTQRPHRRSAQAVSRDLGEAADTAQGENSSSAIFRKFGSVT